MHFACIHINISLSMCRLRHIVGERQTIAETEPEKTDLGYPPPHNLTTAKTSHKPESHNLCTHPRGTSRPTNPRRDTRADPEARGCRSINSQRGRRASAPTLSVTGGYEAFRQVCGIRVGHLAGMGH